MDMFLRKAYDTNKMRTNIINWFEFNRQGKMLIVGDIGEVVLDYLRTKIGVIHKSPQDGVLYDYIICFDGGTDKEFDALEPELLKTLCRQLRPDGKCFIALANQFGMKYLSGAVDEKSGKAFTGLEGFDDSTRIKGYSRNEVVEAMNRAGFRRFKFYYPVPDHLFPEAIYSDDFLPQVGDLRGMSPSYVEGGIATFQENMVFDRACEKGEFPMFANSFLVVAG